MQESALTWEAFRLTSKSPSELMEVLGPHGVDNLIHQALATAWRDLPADQKNLPEAKRRVGEAFVRNVHHWSKIKKATPAAFFENLPPHPVDQYIRQAFVLCHMMLPRGKRALGDVLKVVTRIYQRNLEAWDEDHRVFTHGFPKRSAAPKRPAPKKRRRSR
jgi:hypothetical protein